MPYSVKKTARIKSGQSLKSNKINYCFHYGHTARTENSFETFIYLSVPASFVINYKTGFIAVI